MVTMNKELKSIHDTLNVKIQELFIYYGVHDILDADLTAELTEKIISTIKSYLLEHGPKEKKETETLIIEDDKKEKQIHPLSNWEIGFNQALQSYKDFIKEI